MSLTEEQKTFLEEAMRLKTPNREDPKYKGEYEEVCYCCAEIRNTAKDGLEEYLSFEKAKERINAHLERTGLKLENAVG